MADPAAEAAMRRACDLIMSGDYLSAMADLSPEAMADAMNLGSSLSNIPVPESYEILEREEMGNEERFVVLFKSGAREMQARATWRPIDGAWKIVAIGIDSMT